MTTKRSAVPCPRDPVGLGLEASAFFLGVSANTFQQLVREHKMPPPRRLASRRIWFADELIAALLKIPYDTTGLKPGPMLSHDADIAEDPYDRPFKA